MRLYKYLLQESSNTPSKDFKNTVLWSNSSGYFSRFITNDVKFNFEAQYDGETWTVEFGFYRKEDPYFIDNNPPKKDIEKGEKYKFEYEFFSNLKLVFQDFISKRKPKSFSFSAEHDGLIDMYKSNGFKGFVSKHFGFKRTIDEPKYWRYEK